MSPGFHTIFYVIVLLSSLPSVISTLYSPLELPFMVLLPEGWGFSFLVQPHTSNNCLSVWCQVMGGQRERKKVTGVHMILLGSQLLSLQRRSPLPPQFEMTVQTLLLLCLCRAEHGLDRRWWKTKKQNGDFSYSLNLGVPFPAPQARKWRILSIFLSTPVCPTGFGDTCESSRWYQRGKIRKLTTSLLVLRIMVSFPNLPAINCS